MTTGQANLRITGIRGPSPIICPFMGGSDLLLESAICDKVDTDIIVNEPRIGTDFHGVVINIRVNLWLKKECTAIKKPSYPIFGATVQDV